MTPDPPGEDAGHLSTGDLLAQWLLRTAGNPLTGHAWRLTDPLDRGSRFVEAEAPAACTAIGEPRVGGQAAVARGVVSGSADPVAIRLALASTDPRAQQRERLQVGIGQLSRTHRQLLPALVRTVESFLMSVPAASFYSPDGRLRPGSATVEVWVQVLEWCPTTLADELNASRGRGLGVEVVVRGMLPVMRTLHGMHELGYVHRDLDPSNILVAEDGGLRVADFGIAVQMRAEHTHTMTEAWGKPGRMPPEALEGQHVVVGPAYDAWQAGFVIAEAAIGSGPVLPGGGFSPRTRDLPKPVWGVLRELLEPARAQRLALDVAIERLEEWLDAVEVGRKPKPQKPAGTQTPPKLLVAEAHSIMVRPDRPARHGRRRIVGVAAATAVLASCGLLGFQPWETASAGDRRTSTSPSMPTTTSPAPTAGPKVKPVAVTTAPVATKVAKGKSISALPSSNAPEPSRRRSTRAAPADPVPPGPSAAVDPFSLRLAATKASVKGGLVDKGDEVSVTASGRLGYGLESYDGCPDAPGRTTTGVSSVEPSGEKRTVDGYTCSPKYDGGAPAPSAPVGSLLARVGRSGAWNLVGANGSFIADSAGDLYFAYNDPYRVDDTGGYDIRYQLNAE